MSQAQDRPVYRNLVFEGGGAKGVAYAGAVRALEELGVLGELRRYAGTSVGSISATLLALGYSVGNFHEPDEPQPDTLFEKLIELDFTKFKDGRGPRAVWRLWRHFGLYKGNAFLKWMRQQIEASGHGLAGEASFADFHRKGLPELKVMGSNLSTHEGQEFSLKTTPDLPVAQAIRVSIAMPFFFAAVRDPLGAEGVFVDGGVLRNYPIEIFDGTEPSHETLGLNLIRQGGPPPPKPIHNLAQYFAQLFETMHHTQNYLLHRNEADMERSVLISNLGVKATDFDMTRETKLALMRSGYDSVMDYLGTRGFTA